MDIGLGDASAFLEQWGFPVFVAVVCLGIIGSMVAYNHKSMVSMIDSFSQRIESLTGALMILTDKVSTPYNDVSHSMTIYLSITSAAMTEQIKIIGDILYENDLIARKDQIKDNVRKEFERLNHEAASKISGFKSVCGDMGKYYLDHTDLDHYLAPIFYTIFGDKEAGAHKKVEDKRKIKDVKTHLCSHNMRIWMELEQNGVSN